MRKACKLVLIDVDVTIDVKKPHHIIVYNLRKHQIGCFIFTFEIKNIFFY